MTLDEYVKKVEEVEGAELALITREAFEELCLTDIIISEEQFSTIYSLIRTASTYLFLSGSIRAYDKELGLDEIVEEEKVEDDNDGKGYDA